MMQKKLKKSWKKLYVIHKKSVPLRRFKKQMIVLQN